MKAANSFLIVLLLSAITHSPHVNDVCGQPPQDKAVALVAPFDEATAKAGQMAWAKHISKLNVMEKNSLEMEMVLIPQGSFTMGSPSTETGRAIDENQVPATLKSTAPSRFA